MPPFPNGMRVMPFHQLLQLQMHPSVISSKTQCIRYWKKIMCKRRKENIIKDTFWYITEISAHHPHIHFFKTTDRHQSVLGPTKKCQEPFSLHTQLSTQVSTGSKLEPFLLWGEICNQCTATPPWAISNLPRPWTKVITEQRWATSTAINKAESSLKDIHGRNSVLTTTAVNPWLGVTWVEPLGSDIEVRKSTGSLEERGCDLARQCCE